MDELKVRLQPTIETDPLEGYRETELGLLPDEWEVIQLGEAITVHDSRRVPLNSTQRAQMSGIYPYYGANGVVDYINDFIFKGEHVLVAEDGGYWGPYEPSAYVVGGQFWVNNHAHIIEALPEKADNHYLMYLLRYMDLSGFISGTTRGKLNQGVLKKIPVFLPSLFEQRAIAHVIRTVQEAKEATERVISSARELKRSLMHHLFTYGPVPVDEAEQVPLKETEVGPVPEHWETHKCKSLCEKISVGVVVKPSSYYVSSGVPAFRSFNIREDRLVANDLVYFSEDANETKLSKSRLKSGDVLIVRTGAPGVSCVVPPEFENANCIDLVFARPQLSVILSGYLSRFFNSSAGKRQALASKTGLAQQHLNVSAVKRTFVPLPPLEEQHHLVSVLSAVDRKISVEKNRVRSLEILFQTLLHHLMTGKVRVDDLDHFEVEEVV